MSAHSRHYLDLNQPPNYRLNQPPSPSPLEQVRVWRPDTSADTGSLIALALAMFFVGLFAFSGLAAFYMHRGELGVRAPHSATAQAFEQPQISIEDARIEGFRAGMATAAAQGCPATTLSQPIATR